VIRAILACDDNWGIGKNGTLPWPHNPADQKWFKECTVDSTVVMGKTTWDDPDMPKPLPKRKNVVVTSTDAPGAHIVTDLISAKKMLPQMDLEQDVWIIGGARLVSSLLAYIDEFWLSRIPGTYDCDTFLPKDLIETSFYLHLSEKKDGVYIEKWRAY
jgi:dihydrofolate reductase